MAKSVHGQLVMIIEKRMNSVNHVNTKMGACRNYFQVSFLDRTAAMAIPTHWRGFFRDSVGIPTMVFCEEHGRCLPVAIC